MEHAPEAGPRQFAPSALTPAVVVERRITLAQIAGIMAGPLVLAALGLTHPTDLNADTAAWWTNLHLLLIPLFPLLGLNLWWLLAGHTGPFAWLGRLAGFVYILCYGALDILAGVATGTVRDHATHTATPELTAAIPPLFAVGNVLGDIGAGAFLVGALIVGTLHVARNGRRALPGALILCGAGIVFLRSHIYFPVGVATMLAFAAGFGLLQWARPGTVEA